MRHSKSDALILLGDFLRGVAHYTNGDRHHQSVIRAGLGANQTSPPDGGFLVPDVAAAYLWQRMYQTGGLLKRANGFDMPFGKMRLPTVDERSRADGSRFGGIAMQWVPEGGTVNASRPKFANAEFVASKLTGAAYVTNELLGDAAGLGAVIDQLFTMESTFVVEDCIVNGSGVGQPLGYLHAPALITVAAEAGQSAGTINAANVVKMRARLWTGSEASAVWLVNPAALPQLYTLVLDAGTAVVPLFGWGSDGVPRLMGIPVMTSEYSPAVGTVGDISLVDLSQYGFGERSIQVAWSPDKGFLTDESVFRFTYRVDGEPLWSTPTTPKNGTDTVSPFVTLAAR